MDWLGHAYFLVISSEALQVWWSPIARREPSFIMFHKAARISRTNVWKTRWTIQDSLEFTIFKYSQVQLCKHVSFRVAMEHSRKILTRLESHFSSHHFPSKMLEEPRGQFDDDLDGNLDIDPDEITEVAGWDWRYLTKDDAACFSWKEFFFLGYCLWEFASYILSPDFCRFKMRSPKCVASNWCLIPCRKIMLLV